MSTGIPNVKEERGFTLVEALIALIIGGVLAASLVGLMVGQSRFYEHSDDTIYAEHSVRAAFDLMTSELRMAAPGDLLAAEPDSVSIRFDVARAIVCDSTASDEATLFVYDTVTSGSIPAGFAGTAYSDAYETAFEYADGWTGSISAQGSTPKATCLAMGAPTLADDDLYMSVTGWTGNFTDGVPDQGAVVRRYRRLTYRFAPSAFFASGTALWRAGQELAAPLEASAAFQYVMDGGGVQGSVSSSDFDDVREIRVSVTGLGDDANRFGVDRQLQFDIPLRN